MTESKRAPVLSSLAGNLAVFILLPLLMNGVIFGLGWDRQAGAAKVQMAGIPPGWAVGTIWMVLFTGMGVARWSLLKRTPRWLAEGPSLLAFLCLLYPLYTQGLQNDRIGFSGTIGTAALAWPLALGVWRHSRVASGCLAAVGLWLLYAAGATFYALQH